VRPEGAHAGDVIGLSVHNTGWPNDVTIALNTIRQDADGHAIRVLGAQNATITANTIQCNQPTAGTYAVVAGQSVVPQADNPDTLQDETRPPLPLDGLLVSQNRAHGRCKALVLAAPATGDRVRLGYRKSDEGLQRWRAVSGHPYGQAADQ
jgi:hypothetical protein